MTSARDERRSLCDLLDQVGPDAPTLCGEWTTRDLAAHLVVRERRPDAALGIVATALARHGESVRRAESRRPYTEIVDRVRSGPPVWSPTALGPIDALANTVEMFVHHEDVRRATEPWQPRALSPRLDADLAAALSRMARLLARRAPCGIVAQPAGHDAVVVKRGEPSVTLRAPAGELILFLYGRQAHSIVDVDGPADLADAVRHASFGI